jgi:Cache domain
MGTKRFLKSRDERKRVEMRSAHLKVWPRAVNSTDPRSLGKTAFFDSIDPKRSFKASHSPTTKVLGSPSHRLGRLREGHMRRRELIIALGFAMAWPIAAKGQPDVRALRSQILLMQAERVADRLAEFITQAQNQVGWTTQLPPTGGSIEQRQFDALRLLRQAPAITELSLLDAEGKGFYKVSRLAMDVVGSATDYSKEAKFTETVAKKIFYGPVYLRGESEPYMTLGLAGTRRDAGVSVVELNFNVIQEIVQQTKVGNRGVAYVVDARGRVIAHPDFDVRKSRRDLSTLAQVQEAVTTRYLTGPAYITRDMNNQKVVAAYARVAGPGYLIRRCGRVRSSA